MQKLLENSS